MNWRAEAMDKLRQYDAMELAAKNLPLEIRRAQLSVLSTGSPRMDGMPSQLAPGPRDDKLLSHMVYDRELKAALAQAELWLEMVNRALSVLPPEGKLILSRLYMYPEKGAVDRLCGELGVEQSTVYRKRDKALYDFTVALYGKVEQ